MGMESLEGNGGNALTLEERLAAKEKERLERLAEKEKAAEEEEARKARGEEAKKDFLAKKREEQERAKTIQAAIAASKREPEPEPELEPESAAVSAAVLQEGTPPLKMKDCVALLQDEIGGISGLSPKDTIAAAAEAYGIELDASDTVKQQLHTLAKECGIETGW